ncbi:MAG TPA: thioesterase family protein [Candidatus Omnitrophota bacterium]|nr:thioesterase family protein [Candidatus Omnitrophota bacterium]HPS20839.1 thioesterase family protein [Candidatus Omnitrophota bacterium]
MAKYGLDIRVRYADTDQMGVVYYSNYLVWFEVARTELLRAYGADYKSIENERKIYLPVVETYCRYKAPLSYDDLVHVDVWVSDMGRTRITFEYELRKGDLLTTFGNTKHVFIDGNRKPVSIPEDLKKALEDVFIPPSAA